MNSKINEADLNTNILDLTTVESSSLLSSIVSNQQSPIQATILTTTDSTTSAVKTTTFQPETKETQTFTTKQLLTSQANTATRLRNNRHQIGSLMNILFNSIFSLFL